MCRITRRANASVIGLYLCVDKLSHHSFEGERFVSSFCVSLSSSSSLHTSIMINLLSSRALQPPDHHNQLSCKHIVHRWIMCFAWASRSLSVTAYPVSKENEREIDWIAHCGLKLHHRLRRRRRRRFASPQSSRQYPEFLRSARTNEPIRISRERNERAICCSIGMSN